MTADEVSFAGGIVESENRLAWYSANNEHNSITGQIYWWLFSPDRWNSSNSGVQIFMCKASSIAGSLSSTNPGNSYAVRPVISISKCAKVKSGNGTPDSPYEIDENSCS